MRGARSPGLLPTHYIPGPPPGSKLGSIVEMVEFDRDPISSLAALQKQYGNLVLLSGAFTLKREGETRVKVDPGAITADQLRLQRQLAEINRMLTKVARS